MWDMSPSPLRAMDEFDKNMDQTFLQASLYLLLEACEKHPNRQVMILTPNDYHGCLVGDVCRPIYERLEKAAGEKAVEILHMPAVDRDAMA